MARFTHLHVHSEFSLLDGLAKIDQLMAKALEMGMDSLALTDHGNLYGAVKFYLAAQEFGIKPIIGTEIYMAARSRFDKQANIDADRYHLIILAKNQTGYKNLLKLVTLAHLEGFYYRPRIDMESLRQYSSGLIVTTACLEGEIPQLLLVNQLKKAEAKAKEFQEIFGKDFYLEIQSHPLIENQKKANEALIKLSRGMGLPLVATNDVHYVNPQDAEAQDALLAVQTQKMIADKNRLSMLDSPDFYLRSQEEMMAAFRDCPEAIDNTQKIAQKCDLEIPIGQWILPDYPLPEGKTADEYLQELVFGRLKDRFQKPTKEITERLEYELSVIKKKGFSTYFLIVQDFVNWAKKQQIRVGPGRGSAPGSLVSYVLRITSIDPIKHVLPFERFMNPERPSPPDIDLDFADDRRDEVIEYITHRYGRDKVAQIVTFNVMKAREAVRDIGRVLGMPYSEPDKIAKLIPFGMNISDSLKTVPELATLYKEAKYKKLLDLSLVVEGTTRHASTHAAGLVIGDKELTEYVPLQKVTRGEGLMTQYDMYSLDLNVSEKAIGLLKIDLLGLRNLTILEKTLNFVRQTQGLEIDLSEISIEDKEALQIIAKGETTGIFQLESAGFRRLALKLKPTKFSDISAMVALFRPGPMQFIDEFIAGKKHPATIHYPHPNLKSILAETYGIAVYQEQCLQIAHAMGGYSLGEADILRRAIGKKKFAIMEREKNKFVKRACDQGYRKEVAEKVFALIERFAGYGFNKAHSTSYAMIAYQTAYLKAHFPVEFMAAILSAEAVGASGPNKDEKIAHAVEECRRMKIIVFPPDINQSQASFIIVKEPKSLNGLGIRFGLSAIKNVGEAAIKAILKTRDQSGDFKSLGDFCQRVDAQKVNKKVIESLIKVGAMDQFGKRASMLSGLDQVRNKSYLYQKQQSNGQTSFFDQNPGNPMPVKDELPEIEEFSREELLSLEKGLLGIYLTEHPLANLLAELDQYRSHKLFQITAEEHKNKRLKIGGMVTDLRVVFTRQTNQEMAFAKIEDDTGSIEAVVFPRVFKQTRACWFKDQVIVAEGRVEYREEKLAILLERAMLFEEVKKLASGTKKAAADQGLMIRIPSQISSAKLVALNKLLKDNPGNDEVSLAFVDKYGEEKIMPLPFKIKYSQKLKQKIALILEKNT
jgi:DNA polymerase-3 subunit alpha